MFLLRYFAGAIREAGRKKLNSDGIMIKGFHTDFGDVVAAVLCHSPKPGKRWAMRMDRLIRIMERELHMRIYEAESLNELSDHLSGIFYKKILRHKWVRDCEVTAFITCDGYYFVMCNHSREILFVDKDKSEVMPVNASGPKAKSGRILSAVTVLLGTEIFFKKLSEKEIFDALCPQMQLKENSLREGLILLSENIKEREEEMPFSAASICVR